MRYTKNGRRMRKKLRIIIIFIIIIIIGAMLFLEMRMKPVIRSVAALQAKSYATEVINETVANILEELELTPESLEIVTSAEDGTLTSISTNTVMTNKLKNLITVRTQDELSNIRNRRADVPLGTIIGGELFNGLGPAIPVHISISGNISSDFEEEFESGGINQTVHKLSVRIIADLTIIMPMNTSTERVETTVLIGETVIIGNSPGGMIWKTAEN